MASEQSEADSFLALIERKIAVLQALADSYKAALAAGALGQPGDDSQSIVSAVASASGSSHAHAVGGGVPFELPAGVFLGKSMPQAIKLYYTATRKKKWPKEVAAALKEGGLESTSQDFEKTVNSTMHRMKDGGELLKFTDGAFGLAEFYPESLRLRITKDAKPTKAGKGGKHVRRSPQRKGAVKKAANVAQERTPEPNKTSIVLRTLGAHSGVTPEDVLQTLKVNGADCPLNYVFNVLSRLRQQGKVEKRDDGRWYLTQTAAA